jgi:hypothetical protein
LILIRTWPGFILVCPARIPKLSFYLSLCAMCLLKFSFYLLASIVPHAKLCLYNRCKPSCSSFIKSKDKVCEKTKAETETKKVNPEHIQNPAIKQINADQSSQLLSAILNSWQ